jgi:hypothetical protein
MKIQKRNWIPGILGAGCAASLMVSVRATAEVSDADFKALQDAVNKLSHEVQGLEQTNALQQKLHDEDVQKLKELQDKLSQAQKTAAQAEQKSTAVASQAPAQPVLGPPIDEATVNHNFMMLGDAEFQYTRVQGEHPSFALADFAPIFLYRGGDNVLFEAGFDTTLADNAPNSPGYSTTFNLSFAQLDYVMNDYMTLAVGDLLLPLGTYSQRGAGWLNLIPNDPLAVDALIPGSGVGAQLLGAIPIGTEGKYLNYAVYGVNGPSSADGTGNAGALDLGGNVGVRSDGVTANLHATPSGGARVGIFLPFAPHYDFETGISGQSGEWDNQGTHLWSAGVLDVALHLGSSFEAKGEYILTRYGSDDLGQVKQWGYFGQAGYKLAGLNLNAPLINNVELMGRYDDLHDGNGQDTHTRRFTMGFVYYFTTTFLFEGDYEIFRGNDPTQPKNQLIFQLSYGF